MAHEPVTNLVVTSGDRQNVLTWTPPVDTTYTSITVRRAIGAVSAASPAIEEVVGPTGVTDGNLSNNSTYNYHVTANYPGGITSTAVIGSGTPAPAAGTIQSVEGSFTFPTTTGNLFVATPFRPQVIIFFWNDRTTNPNPAAGFMQGFGVATDGRGQWSTNTVVEHLSDPLTSRIRSNSASCVNIFSENGVLIRSASIGTIQNDGFNLTIGAADPTSITVGYIALGNLPADAFNTGQFQLPTTTGPFNAPLGVTNPTTVLFASVGSPTLSANFRGAGLTIGAVAANGGGIEEFSTGFMATASSFDDTVILGSKQNATALTGYQTAEFSADVTDFSVGAEGFTGTGIDLNVEQAPTTGVRVYYLALSGVSSTVISATTPETPTTTTEETPFIPATTLMVGNGQPLGLSPDEKPIRFTIGSVTGGFGGNAPTFWSGIDLSLDNTLPITASSARTTSVFEFNEVTGSTSASATAIVRNQGIDFTWALPDAAERSFWKLHLGPGLPLAPDPVTGVSVVQGFNNLYITWSNPTTDFDEVVVVRSDTTQPDNPLGGTIVYQGTSINVLDNAVVAPTNYYYTIFTVLGDQYTPVFFQATPLNPFNRPDNVYLAEPPSTVTASPTALPETALLTEAYIIETTIEPRYVVLDPIYRPGAVGNNRFRIQGEITDHTKVDTVEWRVTPKNQMPGSWTTAVESDGTDYQKFAFWTYPYQKGGEFLLEIRYIRNGIPVDLDDIYIDWNVESYDTVITRFNNIYMPDFLKESELGRNLYLVQAMALADVYAAYEDCINQMDPAKTTWAIDHWEEIVGVPSIPTLPLRDRRLVVLQHRKGWFDLPLRTTFIERISAPANQEISLVDGYNNYEITINLEGATDDQVRAMTLLANRFKPAGIAVNITDDAFLADISQADVDAV